MDQENRKKEIYVAALLVSSVILGLCAAITREGTLHSPAWEQSHAVVVLALKK